MCRLQRSTIDYVGLNDEPLCEQTSHDAQGLSTQWAIRWPAVTGHRKNKQDTWPIVYWDLNTYLLIKKCQKKILHTLVSFNQLAVHRSFIQSFVVTFLSNSMLARDFHISVS